MPPEPTSPPSLAPRQVLVIFSGLVLAMLLAALDSTIVATALPTIVAELGGLEHLSWIVTAYLLAQTIVTPLYGKLGDLYGRKIVLQGAIVLFLVGSALCGLSGSMAQPILFRGLQGLDGRSLCATTRLVGCGPPEAPLARRRAVRAAMLYVPACPQYSPYASSGKQYSQRSPGSAEATTGWLLDRACLLA